MQMAAASHADGHVPQATASRVRPTGSSSHASRQGRPERTRCTRRPRGFSAGRVSPADPRAAFDRTYGHRPLSPSDRAAPELSGTYRLAALQSASRRVGGGVRNPERPTDRQVGGLAGWRVGGESAETPASHRAYARVTTAAYRRPPWTPAYSSPNRPLPTPRRPPPRRPVKRCGRRWRTTRSASHPAATAAGPRWSWPPPRSAASPTWRTSPSARASPWPTAPATRWSRSRWPPPSSSSPASRSPTTRPATTSTST